MIESKKWFVIINKRAGNGIENIFLDVIYDLLIDKKFTFKYKFTKSKNHITKLVEKAIKKKYTNFIVVGGDGTIHTTVNAILNCKNSSQFKIATIPLGTGNDWRRHYKIPTNIKKAIAIIEKGNTIKQDIGKISLLESNKELYFFNVAGTGYDAFVSKNINKYRFFKSLTYLITGILCYRKYKPINLKATFNTTTLKGKTFMLLIGLCSYSGGGMQLVKEANPTNGLFSISYIKKIKFLDLILNIKQLFNGKITKNKLLTSYKTNALTVIIPKNKENAFIQLDGEHYKAESFKITILPKKINFVVP